MFDYTTVDLSSVTSEQIGRCFKIFDLNHGKCIPFYQVESERDEFVIYNVRWTREQGFTCTCPAGQYGFARTKKGYCKHVLWSLAAAKEEKEALAALRSPLVPETVEQEIQVVEKKEEVVVIEEPPKRRKPTKAQLETRRKREAINNKPFSLLKS